MDVGEIFLSSFISGLLDKLTSGELLKFLGESIDGLLKKWSGKLTMLQAVLSDAETKQNSLSAVKLWLNELQNLAYDLDDIVDALATEALRRKLTAQAGTSNVWNLFSNHFNSKFGAFVFDYRIAHRIEEITHRLEDLIKQRSDLPLFEKARKRPFITGERLPTTSLVNESRICGRRHEKEEVAQMLLSDQSNGDPVTVIPIIGMGGIGKTTLAQLVYNDYRVRNHFDLMVWACVSDDFDISRITKTIFEQVTSQGCHFKDLNMLQVKLKEKLSKRKFLLVLDDVWIDDCEDWEILCLPFLSGIFGSKILVTTRNEIVASIMSCGRSFYLKELNSDDSLSLLAQHALGARNLNEYSDLKEIGEKIVNKCNNLPLAVKTLGGVLRSKLNSNEWEDVLYSNIWDIGDDKNKILPALRLSYHHLPPHLKRCFVYCSIFPKDYEFDKYELILLWMAEGFLNQSNGKNLEDLGSRYFKELVFRSLFQQSGTNNARFVMHPLINDLACYVAGRICKRLEEDFNDDQQYKVSADIRHLSFTQRRHDISPKFENLHEASGLRTFLPLSVNPSEESFISNRVLIDLFPKLKSLRVLSLSGYASIVELPNSIGYLKHLRYLDLSKTWLKWLPESVSTLCNLQTLSLRDCTYLTKLPTSIHNLINLHHLDIAGTYALQDMPSGIGLLKNLRTLPRFLVSKSGGLVLKSLGNLINVGGVLSIEELQNVMNAHEAKEANLKHKTGLRELHLKWSSDFDDIRDVYIERGVLDQLQPPENLEHLVIVSYGGIKFSSWIEDNFFPRLERIRLSKCANCTSLPQLGHLPLLRELYVGGMNKVSTLGAEFYGNNSLELSFPSLEILEFQDMPEWQTWWSIANVGGQFPRLRKLSILSCPKLSSVPLIQLHSLGQLVVKDCGVSLLKSFPHMPSLTHLSLESISAMTSLCEVFVQFPLSLRVLNINCCNDLVTLWPICDVAQNLVCLQEIVVEECPQLASLQEICFLPMLRSLRIERLEALKTLPMHRLSCSLKKLEIMWCEQLATMSEMVLGDYSASLEHLYIWNLANLDVRNCLGSVHNFAGLTELFISGCDGMETFPEGGLPAPSLKKLSIWNCKNLMYLPHRMETLACLEYLSLSYCPSLRLFPQGAFPPNITNLDIKYCETLKPLSEWGLHRLISLQWFAIVGGYPDLVSFSTDNEEEKLLPSTLTTFWIAELPNLRTLCKGFRNLFSLQHLDIWGCPELEALPMEDQLDKLWSLHINDCPLLEKRCLKDKAGYSRMIAEIPDVMIDYCRVPGSRN